MGEVHKTKSRTVKLCCSEQAFACRNERTFKQAALFTDYAQVFANCDVYKVAINLKKIKLKSSIEVTNERLF